MITLTLADGQIIHVNEEQITYVMHDHEDRGTGVHFGGPEQSGLLVQEPVNVVLGRIEAAYYDRRG